MVRYKATVIAKHDFAIARIELYGEWLKMLRIELWLGSVIGGYEEPPPYTHIGQFKSKAITYLHLDSQQFILATIVETRKALEAKLHQ